MIQSHRTSIVREIAIVLAITVGSISVLYHLKFIPFIASYLLLITAAILIYIPMSVYWLRKERFGFIDSSLDDVVRSLTAFTFLSAAIFPAALIINHYYQLWIWHLHFQSLPPAAGIVGFFLSQLLFVALPEEFFYRGYLQERLNQIYDKRWRVLGVACGPAWLLTALIFAVSHSVITIRWWHIFIFFPGLAFGWLREKTGTILAPILFHAACNAFAYGVFRSYG